MKLLKHRFFFFPLSWFVRDIIGGDISLDVLVGIIRDAFLNMVPLRLLAPFDRWEMGPIMF